MSFLGNNATPFLEVLVQPQQRFRFRYLSEVEGSHGSLLGEGSERGKKIYISAKLHNYKIQGKPSMRVTLHTVPKNAEYRRRHAHQLSGKNCKNGVYMVPLLQEDDMTASLQGVWITHIAKKNVVQELKRIKQELIQGFVAIPNDVKRQLSIEATEEAKTMDLNSACLCFEAVVIDGHGVPRPICAPAYSSPIYNLKSTQTGELRICRISKYSGLCKGDEEVWILVEKVKKGNIQIKFFQLNEDDECVFSANATFLDTDVHRQHAIVFRTPPYKDLDITEEVKVKFQLVRPSDNATSDPVEYVYRPIIRAAARKRTTTCVASGGSVDQRPKMPRVPGLRLPSAIELQQQRSLNTPEVVKLVDQWSFESGNTPPVVAPEEVSASLMMSDPGPIPQYLPTIPSSPTVGYPLQVEGTSPAQYSSPVGMSPAHPSPSYSVHLTVSSPSHIQSPSHFSVISGDSLSPGMVGHGSPASYTGSSSYPTSPGVSYSNEDYPSILNHNDIIEGLESIQMLENDLTTDSPGDDRELTTDGPEDARLNNEKKTAERKMTTDFLEVTDKDLSFLIVDVLKNLKPGQKDSLRKSCDKLLKIRTTSGNNAVHLAAYEGATSLIRLLVGLSSDHNVITEPNHDDKTPVDLAVERGETDIVSIFLAAGIPVHTPDSGGDTAIHKAAALGYVDLLKRILASATIQQVNKRNYGGRTALSNAIAGGYVKCVEELLAAGASVNDVAPLTGYSPLHEAVDAEQADVCRLLCSQDGIDGELECFSGLTAYDLAVENENEEIIHILKEAGLDIEGWEENIPSYV